MFLLYEFAENKHKNKYYVSFLMFLFLKYIKKDFLCYMNNRYISNKNFQFLMIFLEYR